MTITLNYNDITYANFDRASLIEAGVPEHVIEQAERGVPKTVMIRQAKRALLKAGLLDDVDALIKSDAVPREVEIEWEYASEVHRTWVEQSGLKAALKMSDQQLDDLFVLAATL